MKRTSILAALMILSTIAAWARAADSPNAGDAAVSPFVDGQTILLIRADLGSVDLKPLVRLVEKAIKAGDMPENAKRDALKSLTELDGKSQQWIDQFKQAGGKQIYIEMNLADIDQGLSIIVPLGDGADASSLENLFATGDAKTALDERRMGREFAITKSCMLFAPEDEVPKLQARQAVARPDLAKALADAGDGPIRMAFVPTEDARAKIMQMLPQFPGPLGGGQTSDVLAALTSGWGSISLAPAPSLRLVVRYKDAGSAATALNGATTLHDAVQSAFENEKKKPFRYNSKIFLLNVMTELAPAREGDKVIVTLDGEKITRLTDAFADFYFRQLVQMRRLRSASNLRQIGQAILLYTNDSKGPFPADLATLTTTEDITAAVFINPATGNELPKNWDQLSPAEQAKWVNEEGDYVYLGAGLNQGPDPAIVVAYEKQGPKSTDGINILFGDGHVEFQDPDRAKKSLEASKAIRQTPK